jgi:hypothetical protein
VFGSFFGRAIVAAVRSVGAVAVNAAMTELRKPETQAKIGQGIATVHQHLNDPEKRAELDPPAGTAGKTAARMLGRAAGNLRNKISGD